MPVRIARADSMQPQCVAEHPERIHHLGRLEPDAAARLQTDAGTAPRERHTGDVAPGHGPISAERRSQRPLGGQPSEADPSGTSSDAPASGEKVRGPLLSEFRYGTWSRSFRFPVAIERDQLQAVDRDGLLTVTAPKANKVRTVTVKVEG